MLNQTAVNDSKDEFLSLDLNLQNVAYTIEAELSPGKYNVWLQDSSAERLRAVALQWQVVLSAVFAVN